MLSWRRCLRHSWLGRRMASHADVLTLGSPRCCAKRDDRYASENVPAMAALFANAGQVRLARAAQTSLQRSAGQGRGDTLGGARPCRITGECLGPAITCRWRSGQDFPRWIASGDRFTAANLNPALARPGHDLPSCPQVELPLERPLHLGCCQTVSSPMFVLSKVRQEGRARNRAVAGGGIQPLDKRVQFA